MVLRKEDIYDLDFLSRDELISDGYKVYANGFVVSVIGATKTIITDFFLYSIDAPVQSGDRVGIFNSRSCDGYYTIDQIVSDYSFTVLENINDDASGDLYFMHPTGARQIGFDPSGLTSTTARNLQDAIKDLVINGGIGGITEATHETLDTLTHHIAEDGYSAVTYNGNKITNYTIYTSNSMNTKIREYQLSYNINPCHTLVSQVHIIQYNAAGSPINTLTESFEYIGNKIVGINSVKT